MREMVFKNLTSIDKRRRDLFISETVEQNGIKTITKRHSIYIIGKHAKFSDIENPMVTDNLFPAEYNKRHVFIHKKKDTKLGKDTFVCDVIGRCCAVIKDEAYAVVFKHSFEIDFVLTKQE
jgi:hypothetical protein